jgi:hypothetical protein
MIAGAVVVGAAGDVVAVVVVVVAEFIAARKVLQASWMGEVLTLISWPS